jgi:D-glycero-alpha-D-manno-heptose-7-phosphate kinase
MPPAVVEASAPARIDLAGGTLDLWPLHVLHPGSVTVNLAIDRRATCRVRPSPSGWRVQAPESGLEAMASRTAELLEDPRTALVGSLLEASEVTLPLEIEFSSGVPFGSGLGGSSALTVALAGALERFGARRPDSADPVAFVRDVETRVLGKPAGVQDYYPPLAGGLHRIRFEAGRTRAERDDVDALEWERHLTLFDTGASHSSGMNNWEVFRARLEGDRAVTQRLEEVRRAAVRMANAVAARDFPEMGRALAEEWDARRRLAPVVSTPTMEKAISCARQAGAWAGKGCGAGGGGCVVFLSPPETTAGVRRALAALSTGAVLPVRAENRGLEVRESPS